MRFSQAKIGQRVDGLGIRLVLAREANIFQKPIDS